MAMAMVVVNVNMNRNCFIHNKIQQVCNNLTTQSDRVDTDTVVELIVDSSTN